MCLNPVTAACEHEQLYPLVVHLFTLTSVKETFNEKMVHLSWNKYAGNVIDFIVIVIHPVSW